MATKEEIAAFFTRDFPQTQCRILEVNDCGAPVLQPITAAELRPGGTVSGPVLMATADVALYVAVLGRIGIVPLTVTTSFNINFLRKPAPDRSVLAVCTLLKVGRSLAVGEVALYSEGLSEVLAHAIGTYAIPPSARTRGA